MLLIAVLESRGVEISNSKNLGILLRDPLSFDCYDPDILKENLDKLLP